MKAWTVLALAATTSACSVSAGPPPPPAANVGTAVMDWTVNESKDPASCNATGAATFHVSLTNSAGGFAGEWVQDCTAFATTIDGLLEDTYTGQADMLDANGQPRTTMVSLAPFQVVGGASVTVAVDFPANSFY